MSKRLLFLLTFIILLPSCMQAKQHQEPGAIPTEVIWNAHKYKVTSHITHAVGKKLGRAETSLGQDQFRDVYQIRGKDVKQEIAIAQLNHMFFVATAE